MMSFEKKAVALKGIAIQRRGSDRIAAANAKPPIVLSTVERMKSSIVTPTPRSSGCQYGQKMEKRHSYPSIAL